MKNLKVASKLILGFSIVAFISLIVGLAGTIGIITLNNSEDKLYREGVESLIGISGMYSVIVEQRLELRGIIINLDDEIAVRESIELLHEREKEFEELYQAYAGATTGEDAKENALIETALTIYRGQFTTLKGQMLSAFDAGDKQAVREAFDQTAKVAEEATEVLYQMVLYGDERAAQMNANDGRMAQMLVITSAVLTVILVALSIILGIYISGIISKPLVLISGFLRKASVTGDLRLRPEDLENIKRLSMIKDEIGMLSNSLSSFLGRIDEVNTQLDRVAHGDLTCDMVLLSDKDSMGISVKQMMDSLNTMFAEINTASQEVSKGAGLIAEGAQSLAQGATEQASSIEQLSASISEIAEQTSKNADISKRSASLSDTIRENAEKGSEQMNQMVKAVEEINEASNQISKVIKVIDDIAFQTNILALNAAVEAARAGQHGKGFAVVAEEVRNLAAKSSEAAKDSGGLIENSIAKANLGLSIATQTSASLKEIVDGINQNAEIADQIARSSNEQAGAISQINVGIDQVAQVVQQNSATAEESAAASEEMSGQSNLLTQLISRFKLRAQ